MKDYNILVVDDDEMITEAIEIYLKNEGYNVFKAYDGIEALKILDNSFNNYGYYDAQYGWDKNYC